MHPLLELAIEDIFNKYDMNINGVLAYKEFKGFCDCIGVNLTHKEFVNNFLVSDIYETSDESGLSGEAGLTLGGFRQFFYERFKLMVDCTD